MKTHVLTFAKRFMKGHPREGEPTTFSKQILLGKKIHTIRANVGYWVPKVKDVRYKDGYLSLRYWTGKPYRSKQREFLKVHGNNVNKPTCQSILIEEDWRTYVSGQWRLIDDIAENDGLTVQDFKHWFKDNLPFRGVIIHFTDFRY